MAKNTPVKITEFEKIPQLTRMGSWECDFDPSRVYEWLIEHGFDINPDFQRDHVWTEAQQIAYVEYFFKGGKTGRTIYMNDPEWLSPRITGGGYNDKVLVDGKQRVEALRRFFANEIPVFGSFYREYTDKIRLMSNTFKINVNNLKTRREVLQWYVDFNAGGTVHTDDEIAKVRKMIKKESV